MERKIDSILSRLNSIDATLLLQHEQLKNHIKRTELLEAKLIPLESFILRLMGGMATVGALGATVTLIKFLWP